MSDATGFLAALNDRLYAADDDALTPFVDALNEIDLHGATRPFSKRLDHPAMSLLDPCLCSAYDSRFLPAARALNWSQLYDGEGIDESLSQGMLAAQFAGTYGRYPTTLVATGFFLLAPNICYPLHTHAAKEVYLTVSGALNLRHGTDNAPFCIEAGEFSITPSGCVHELRTYDTPTLLAYIWTGDLTAPTWWWSKDASGDWIRTAWERKPGEAWRPGKTETLSEEQWKSAQP